MKIPVRLGARSYPIWVGPRSIQETVEDLARWLSPGALAFVLADRKLAGERRRLCGLLKRAGYRVEWMDVSATESFKDLGRLGPVFSRLIQAGCDRKSVLFALGGGVLGDAVGFVAGTFMRGIRWVGVPSTLLAQVDSSIGGKTAVNHPRGKNLIGVFHQPSGVACDPALLMTLPRRERVSGLGEVVKYALIYDRTFFGFLEREWRGLVEIRAGREAKAIFSTVVARCARFKARAVSRDERDALGIREVLNFGHTLGHALESATAYRHFRHGEAIILGMRAATHLSVLRGHLAPGDGERVERLLADLPVPGIPRGISDGTLLKLVKHDKKAVNGRVRFVLLDRIGHAVLDRGVSDSEIRSAIRLLLEPS